MHFDVLVVGGGTAGCALAARLSESEDRSVCLLEAGPDYGPLAGGRWPPEILDARRLPTTHDWGPGGEDGRHLGGRLLGGSSAVNACMVMAGSAADYDEWGDGWSFEELRPHLARAKTTLRTAGSNTDRPHPFHTAFLEAARAAGLPLLADPNSPATGVGVAAFPANVVDGNRWNAALAYLEEARDRSNLTIVGGALVDRVELDGVRAVGALCADGCRFEAARVVLAAGAYFSPAILLRSGIGPEAELRRLDIPLVQSLPVGERLLDHYGTGVVWQLSPGQVAEAAVAAEAVGPFAAHVVAKAASSECEPGSWDLHLLPWIHEPGEAGHFEASTIVFHMKPLSTGQVRLRSRNPADAPLVQRGFLTDPRDLVPLLEGIELARSIGATGPLAGWIAAEVWPGEMDPEHYVRDNVRNYFHPAGTCALGAVVDRDGGVLGFEGLTVADASLMPTIPRANTNLTTAAIAERIAAVLSN
jgi:choline dehydrogenase